MKVWIIHLGKSYLGRVLGRSREDALRRAGDFWGRGKRFKIEAVT